MTAHDETPAEIVELERVVQAAVEEMSKSDYLDPSGARELLAETAHHRAFVSSSTSMVDIAAGAKRFTWPPELNEAQRRETVGRLLGGCGIIVEYAGDFRFARPEVEAYLAAWQVVRRHPRGPRRWDPRTWKYLAPQPTWPWPGSEVHLFLAALWWPGARTAVERQLARLLHERYRDPNVHFVLELVRRNLLPGSDLGPRTARLLREALTGDRLDEQDWANTAGWLHQLDPENAVAELETIVRFPLPGTSDRRRLLATTWLLKHVPDRGRGSLEILAANLCGPPPERFEVARAIADLDPALGVRVLLQLANTPDMHDLRADAAIASGRPGVMAELVEHGRGLSDEARLRLISELLTRDRARGVAAAQRFAATAAAATRLRVAELLKPHDAREALRIANAVAWPPDSVVDGGTRFGAVILIGKIDPAKAIPALEQLSATASVPAEIRLDAATYIVTEHQGPVTALVKLAQATDVSRTHRARAAQQAGRIEPETGARLLVALAESAPLDSSRLDLLKKAHALHPKFAAETLAKLAGNRRAPGRLRIQAVDLAGPALGKPRRLALYSEIAATADDETALAAARKVLAADPGQGRRLMAALAARTTASFPYRLAAAQEAGREAMGSLRELSTTARPETLRLEAAQALAKFDQSSAKSALKGLVKRNQGQIRIDAALSLTGTSAVDALTRIACDRHEKDTFRLEAALEAKKLEQKRGRQLLRDLAGNPRNSRALREAAQRHLKK
ncbi:hypothetical protein FHX82_003871 [Amycolatopsis bartoniae]|uniref:HEAT repeat domain-containing protein n=1 Tax=Amycolatopsis bartoniae TaxID=941986 RepID=A0A8H9MD88_9PSEU|nr:hypothetical protein [Amycolatopsis bartoniae]MBB2936807.1 hypothetical protein [Amycolatopsis bartoniae]TVT09149.1 hypothetical protein FNH07_09605 [Amycolatopsis bartoniae]GHF50273.1 hypothetical protein GCM10017566_24230 [Amycolatopsis bartoniae]